MIILPRWVLAMVLYIMIIFVLVALRPALLFEPDGTPKKPGLGLREGPSMFAPAISFPLIGFLCFFISFAVRIALL